MMYNDEMYISNCKFKHTYSFEQSSTLLIKIIHLNKPGGTTDCMLLSLTPLDFELIVCVLKQTCAHIILAGGGGGAFRPSKASLLIQLKNQAYL